MPKKRSKTAIIVKNLPAKTPIETIRNKFASHGELQRVIMPPDCPTCLLEFTEPSEARTAFRSLAYINFNGNPLYLEWAPEDAFTKPADKSQKVSNSAADVAADAAQQTKPKPEIVEEKSNSTGSSKLLEENSTLFVKNLNFNTTDESLREFFESALGGGTVHEATIAKKNDTKNPGKVLSMGYGFVQFKKASIATEALKNLQHRLLDEHSIELKRSNRAENATEAVKTSRKVSQDNPGKASTKLIVRNVPFEATQKEVQDIFATFGNLKSVRLPKKVTGSHRGFAFVEFLSKEEAQKGTIHILYSTKLSVTT